MRGRLRVGVSKRLLELPPVGGTGKVWNRGLAVLSESVAIVPLDAKGEPVRRIRRRRPAVVLADGHADLLPASVPRVVEVHEVGWVDPEQRRVLNPEFVAGIAPRTERAIRAASRVITLSEAARRDIAAAFPISIDRIDAVHLGVDSVFTPDAGEATPPVQIDGQTGEGPYILYAGVLHPRKNLPLLAAAVARLADEGLPQLLVVAGGPAGDGSDPNQLLQAARAELREHQARLVHVGQPSDLELAALMSRADAFCLPSMYEGFGLTALEAMACGAPVIVSNRGALPEVVDDAGLAVEPTAEALADALRMVLTDRETALRLRHAAQLRAQEFTWERTGAGWLEALLRAADQGYTRRR